MQRSSFLSAAASASWPAAGQNGHTMRQRRLRSKPYAAQPPHAHPAPPTHAPHRQHTTLPGPTAHKWALAKVLACGACLLASQKIMLPSCPPDTNSSSCTVCHAA